MQIFRRNFRVSNLNQSNTVMLSLNLNVFAAGGATLPDKIDGTTVWSYLDDNSDPAGDSSTSDYDRTAWTAEGFDTNLQYGGSNQGPDTLNISLVDFSLLHNGENTLAVELHNGRKTSSDVWFSFGGLYLSTDEVIYQNNISLSVHINSLLSIQTVNAARILRLRK